MLETRGLRPPPKLRGAIAKYLEQWFAHELRRRHWAGCHREMMFHEMCWGVPVGPTLSMVDPPNLRGITHWFWTEPWTMRTVYNPQSFVHLNADAI